MNTGYLTCERTAKGNNVYTPFYAVEPLLKYIPENKIIWCPFDEKWSAFVQIFINNGYKVVSSCISENKDFFTYEPKEWDILISNPPYSLKTKILKRCYEFNKPFVLLLPLPSLQGIERYKLFKNGL